MPATAPIFAEPAPDSPGHSAGPEPALPETPDHVHRLESEIAELRDTVARFAELVIGEVKDLRQSRAEAPAFNSEAPITPLANTPPPGTPRPWLLSELARDFGTAARMYLDPRYRVRRSTQMLVPLIVVLFVGSSLFFNYVFSLPFLSVALERFEIGRAHV